MNFLKLIEFQQNTIFNKYESQLGENKIRFEYQDFFDRLIQIIVVMSLLPNSLTLDKSSPGNTRPNSINEIPEQSHIQIDVSPMHQDIRDPQDVLKNFQSRQIAGSTIYEEAFSAQITKFIQSKLSKIKFSNTINEGHGPLFQNYKQHVPFIMLCPDESL